VAHWNEQPIGLPSRHELVLPSVSSAVRACWRAGVINGVIGGAIGGYKVGGARRAMLAAILPAAVVAVALWLIFALAEAPVWGILAGLTAAALVALADVGIFIGAAIGGALANRNAIS
jgi:hypothetical protein